MSNEANCGWYRTIISTKYPAYNTRLVLICVHSQGFLFTLLTGYHTDVCCTNTFDAHSITNAAVEQESSVQKKEWYLPCVPTWNGAQQHNIIISLLSLGVLQSLAVENNVVWHATRTSKRIMQMHNTIWTLSHSATPSIDNRSSNIIDRRSVVASNL
jgi:hypothetical protein